MNVKLQALQVAVYVMCGGGLLGSFAARDPWHFYIDARVGRLPYSRRDIKRAVAKLAQLAEEDGFVKRDHLPDGEALAMLPAAGGW
jgi:hypothetical protein